MKFILKIFLCFGIILLGKITKEDKVNIASTSPRVHEVKNTFASYRLTNNKLEHVAQEGAESIHKIY
jgi:hypothetical protein